VAKRAALRAPQAYRIANGQAGYKKVGLVHIIKWGRKRTEDRSKPGMIKMRRQGNDREREARGQPAVTGRQDASEKRLRVEVATLVALMALFGFLSIQSPEGQQWRARVRHLWQERERARAFQQALTNDPPIGTPLERLGLPSLPFVPSRSLPFLVVVFGGCEGCGAQRLKEWAEVLGGWETWRKHLRSVLVVQDKEGKVREVVARNGWKVTVIADEDGKIGRTLNAFFTPRAYGFEGGKLVWVQKEAGMGVAKVLESFLGRIKGEGEAKGLLNAWAAEMREKAWGKMAVAQPKRGDQR